MFKKTCSVILLLCFIFSGALASADSASNQEKLIKASETTLQNFLNDPDMVWVKQSLKDAKAILIIPRKLSGAFIFGGDAGSGVMLARANKKGWSNPAFYTMGTFSFGLQAGGKVSEVILLIMTDKGIDSVLSTDVKLGADLSVAAGPVGAGAEAKTADVIAFARSKGVYGGVSVNGAVIKPRNKWNELYYGKPVRAIDILIKRTVSNPSAEGLIRKLNRS